jgi:hypothetical protein
MPRHDLIPPPGDGSAERTHLEGHRSVCEFVDQLTDELVGESGIVEVVDRPDGLLGICVMVGVVRRGSLTL